MEANFLTLFQLNYLPTLFVQYDQIRLKVDQPVFLNFFLFSMFVLATSLTLKKTSHDQPFSVLQTEQMKGLAIIMIVVHHLYTYVLEDYQELRDINGLLGPSGVSVFLILSGFGLCVSLRKKGLKYFFYKRILKLYVPILFAMTSLIFLQHILLHPETNLLIHLTRIFTNLPGIDKNLWFILFILFWYCLVFLAFKLNLSDREKIIFLCLFSLLILTVPRFSPSWKINAFSFPIGCWLSFNSDTVIPQLKRHLNQRFLVILGILSSSLLILRITRGLSTQTAQLSFLGVLLAIGILAGTYFFYRGLKVRKLNLYVPKETLSTFLVFLALCSYLRWVFQYTFFEFKETPKWLFENFTHLLLAFFIILLISLMLKFSLYSSFLSFIGSISFELYLIHGMFLYTFDFILFRGSIYITFFIYFLAICLLSVLLNRVSASTSRLFLKH